MDMEMNAEMERDEGSESREPSSVGSSAGSVYCALERDYARIINEMKNNEALASYETEYTRLFESLYETRRNEDTLMEKCADLQDQVIEKTRRCYDLEKIIESQEESMDKLKQEIAEASRLADAAHTREQNAQEVIENLRLTITKLNHELDLKNKQLAVDEDTTVNKQKDGLLKERERMFSELETLKQRLRNMTNYTEELERKTSEYEQQMSEMRENLDIQRSEISKDQRIRERLEKEINQLEESLKTKDNQLQGTEASNKSILNNVTKLENALREQKTANEKLQKEVTKLMVKRMNLQTELDAAHKKMEQTERSQKDNYKEFLSLSSEVKRTREENGRLKSERDATTKKILRNDSVRLKLETDVEQARVSLRNAELEVNNLRRQVDDEKKATSGVIREKDALAKTITGLKEKLRRAQHSLTAFEIGKRKTEAELEETMQEANELRNKVERIEKERDRLNQEVAELAQQVEDHLDDMKLKQSEVSDYKKRMAEDEAKFRQQQNLFEAVRAERNTSGKALVEARNEIQELKSKLKIMNHQIEQLKEDLSVKDAGFVKEEFLLGKAEKDKDNLRAEVQSSLKTIKDLRREVDESKKTEKRLRQEIHVADMEASRLKKDIDTVMNERDILGSQLVRRNDELSLQYGKIKILNVALQRGEAQYVEKLGDTRLLKLEVKKLRSEKVLLEKSIENMSDLRHEIFHLERELTNERLKVMALQEEVQNPLNVHRWRKLEGSDPDSFELLKKIQILQKRVLKLSAELISKEKKIKECMELYTNLRQEISKRQSPEAATCLMETQKALRERGEKMKSLVAELNMVESQSNEYKFDLERTSRELRDVKSKYYALKRKEQKSKDNERRKVQSASDPMLPAIEANQKKFYGGGFSLGVLRSRNCYSLDSTQK
ncbi:cilia- and flagella-associated protein 58-like [Venturia canescens]|uniref:cilia- and flagella-associated protein 58-like n=1 Tax=Venturia canescens TaxID=32260 RepID=UPI001C9D63B9|nr:cilia- and flagella-associated protein 58-like [Venturia canescens]